MEKLNLALVGAGGIGRQWVEAIQRTKKVALKMVVDVDVKSAAEIAKKIPRCAVSNCAEDAMRNKDIQAILVATPHKWLAPIARAALAAKKHVLSEKPCGVNAGEIKRNTELAKKSRLVYMPGFNHRYHPAYAKAKEIFEQGGIGKILFIRARYGFGGRPGYNKEWRFKKSIAGGGELFDQGIHMIDMWRWFLGDFKNIYGIAENMFWGGDVEDNGFVLLRTARGQVASIHVSWTNWEWVHSFEIYGDKGYLLIDGLDKRYRGPERLTWGRRDMTFAHPKEISYVFDKETKYDSLHRELGAFVEAVLGRGKAAAQIPRGDDAYKAVGIIERIYQTSHSRA